MIPKEVLEIANQEGVGEVDRRLYLKAWEHPSYKNICRAKCIDCCGFEEVRKHVKTCTVHACPIHKIRDRLFSVVMQKNEATES